VDGGGLVVGNWRKIVRTGVIDPVIFLPWQSGEVYLGKET